MALSDKPTPSRSPGRSLAWIVAGLFLLFSIPRLVQFGPTWDVTIGEFAHGEQYLAWISTGDERYLDFSVNGLRPTHREPHPNFTQGLYEWYETHPFSGILAALSCRTFSSTLGWLDAMSAHLLPTLLLSALLLAVLVRTVSRFAGGIAGIAAALALVTSPRFLTEAFSNPKDAPEASLYFITCVLLLLAYERNSTRILAAAGCMSGLALAQKANAAFLPLHWLSFLTVAAFVARRGAALQSQAAKFPWRGIPLALIAFLATYFAASPMLWSDPFERFVTYLKYFLEQSELNGPQGFDAAYAVIITTPPTLVVFAVIGLFAKRVALVYRAFLAVGVLVPIVRTELASGTNFDGVRHYLEYAPFLAGLAGCGVSALIDAATAQLGSRAHVRPTLLKGVGLVLAFLPSSLAVAECWPYGTCYFNRIVGGLGGVQAKRHPDATDYWCLSYWEGIDWISRHAEPGSIVIAPIAPHIVRSIAPLRLRPDLKLAVGDDPPPGACVYVLDTLRRLVHLPVLSLVESNATPHHEIRRQGGVVLRIYRFADPDAMHAVLSRAREHAGGEAASRRILEWLEKHPDQVSSLKERIARDPANYQDAVLSILPEDLHADARQMMMKIAEYMAPQAPRSGAR